MMYEVIGNGAEAEALLRTGKEISNFHGFSVFCIVFTSFLGIYIYFLFPWFISFLHSFIPFLGKHNSSISHSLDFVQVNYIGSDSYGMKRRVSSIMPEIFL